MYTSWTLYSIYLSSTLTENSVWVGMNTPDSRMDWGKLERPSSRTGFDVNPGLKGTLLKSTKSGTNAPRRFLRLHHLSLDPPKTLHQIGRQFARQKSATSQRQKSKAAAGGSHLTRVVERWNRRTRLGRHIPRGGVFDVKPNRRHQDEHCETGDFRDSAILA
ncbi:hypothetical protein B0H14DRAFT_3126137 [Mycena olivaceomarginata]|nr:hypothetical protein B0H14DRAFT_3126137 [Mycena olivaceomarginata]